MMAIELLSSLSDHHRALVFAVDSASCHGWQRVARPEEISVCCGAPGRQRRRILADSGLSIICFFHVL